MEKSIFDLHQAAGWRARWRSTRWWLWRSSTVLHPQHLRHLADLASRAPNLVAWLVVIAVTLAQFAITYLPPLQAVFATEPVPFLDGVLIFGVVVTLFALLETKKQLRLRLRGI